MKMMNGHASKTFSKMFLPAEQNEMTTPAKLNQAMKVLGRYNG